jgi:hypothetical protein
MKIKYKTCEIEVKREKCLGGWDMLFYSIMDGDYEVTSGFSDTKDKVKDFANDLKNVVDEYRENPELYE